MRTSRLPYRSIDHPKLSHYLFRYPAKFHPPVVRELLDRYTREGDTVLDPFCGSGTLLVEAAVLGRNAIGVDVDPVAAFVSRVKTHSYRTASLKVDWTKLQRKLKRLRRSDSEYERRQFDDISETTLYRNLRQSDVWVPQIPNIDHWFRRYVIVDLARLLKVRLNQGASFGPQQVTGIPASPLLLSWGVTTDANNDGRDDLLIPDGPNWNIHYSNGSTLASTATPAPWGWNSVLYLLDVTGDGRAEVLYKVGGNAYVHYRYERGGPGFSDTGISGFRPGHQRDRRNEVHEEAKT